MPENKDKKFITDYDGWDDKSGQSPKINYSTLYRMHKLHSDIYACVQQWQKGVVGAGWDIISADDNKDNTANINRIKAFLDQLDPYKQKDFSDYIKELIMHMAVSGDNYWFLMADNSNQFAGIQSLHPRTMSILITKYGEILGYVQTNDLGEKIYFETDEILHKRFINPNSEIFGMSPLEPLVWEIKTDLMAMKSNFNFFENDGTPPAIAVLDDEISNAEAQRAVKLLQKQHRGLKNKHKLGAMKGVKEIKILGYNMNEMQFKELRKLTTEKICSAMAVPKALIGYTDGVNYSTSKTQEQTFYEQLAKPLQEEVEKIVNNHIFPLIEGTEGLKFILNESTFKDEQAYLRNIMDAAKIGDIVRVNELRVVLELPKLEGDEGEKLIPKGAGGAADEVIQQMINNSSQKKKSFFGIKPKSEEIYP